MAQKKSSHSRRSRSTTARSRKRSTRGRRYSPAASEEVRTEMRHLKQRKHGRRLKSRKQAVAIGLSKARRKGKKVPSRK